MEGSEIIAIDEHLRLRRYDGNYEIAVRWYQDPVVYVNSEGITDPAKIPDADYVKGMYDYLRSNGECYWIEILEEDGFVPIGDITVKAENLPIVVGDSRYRGRGIGKKAMQAAIRRVRELGITKLFGSEVYEYNAVSQRLHESLGFKLTEVRGGLRYYELDLRETPHTGGCV